MHEPVKGIVALLALDPQPREAMDEKLLDNDHLRFDLRRYAAHWSENRNRLFSIRVGDLVWDSRSGSLSA